MTVSQFQAVSIFFLFFFSLNQDQPNTEILKLADPSIFYEDGVYYLYGTASKDGFEVHTSTDRKSWDIDRKKNGGFALRKENVFGDHGFWAPQVFKFENKYYMAYTANEQVAIAESDSPLGPFFQKHKKAIPSGKKMIDPYVFVDDDRIYLYYVQVANGGNRIFVAELNADLSELIDQPPLLSIEATENWENIENATWSVTEGPSVLKVDATYYLIYSANHFRSKEYAVGYATATSPLGPWKKSKNNPVLYGGLIDKNGTGHGDSFKDESGWHYVFHTHFSYEKVGPRKTGIININLQVDNNFSKKKELEFDAKTFQYLIFAEDN